MKYYVINHLTNIAKNRKYDGCQWVLAFMVYEFVDKMSAVSGAVKNKNMPSQ